MHCKDAVQEAKRVRTLWDELKPTAVHRLDSYAEGISCLGCSLGLAMLLLAPLFGALGYKIADLLIYWQGGGGDFAEEASSAGCRWGVMLGITLPLALLGLEWIRSGVNAGRDSHREETLLAALEAFQARERAASRALCALEYTLTGETEAGPAFGPKCWRAPSEEDDLLASFQVP